MSLPNPTPLQSGEQDQVPPHQASVISAPAELPEVGECFSYDFHAKLVDKFLRPSLNKLFRESSDLDLVSSPSAIINTVLKRAVDTGLIQTSAKALLRRFLRDATNDAYRALQRRHREVSHSLDDPHFELATDANLLAPETLDAEAEAHHARVTARIIMFFASATTPKAAALLALWLARSGPDAYSIRALCLYYPQYAAQLIGLYRWWLSNMNWLKNVSPLGNFRSNLLWLVDREQVLPISYTHFYFAADKQHRRAAIRIQQFRTTVAHSPQSLESEVARLRRDAQLHHRASKTMWRKTENAYLVSVQAAEQFAVKLSETL